jgi:hypothetical protein
MLEPMDQTTSTAGCGPVCIHAYGAWRMARGGILVVGRMGEHAARAVEGLDHYASTHVRMGPWYIEIGPQHGKRVHACQAGPIQDYTATAIATATAAALSPPMVQPPSTLQPAGSCSSYTRAQQCAMPRAMSAFCTTMHACRPAAGTLAASWLAAATYNPMTARGLQVVLAARSHPTPLPTHCTVALPAQQLLRASTTAVHAARLALWLHFICTKGRERHACMHVA